MFTTIRADEYKSYKDETEALAALEKKLGPRFAGDQVCTVLLARNSEGRVVPFCCRINHHNEVAQLLIMHGDLPQL